MLIVLHDEQGRWCEAAVENVGEPFPDGYADRFARAHGAILGLSLTPVVVESAKDDPRKGELIKEIASKFDVVERT